MVANTTHHNVTLDDQLWERLLDYIENTNRAERKRQIPLRQQTTKSAVIAEALDAFLPKGGE